MLKFVWVIYMSKNEKPHNRIAELRKEKGLTLQQVADAIGVGNNTISRYETGKREPKLETWLKLADFFGVSVSYLQGISNNRITIQTVDKYLIDKKSKDEPINYMSLLRGVCDDMNVHTFTRLFYAFYDEEPGKDVPVNHKLFHRENELAQKITDPKKITGFVDTFSRLLHSFLRGYGGGDSAEKEFYETVAKMIKNHSLTSKRD